MELYAGTYRPGLTLIFRIVPYKRFLELVTGPDRGAHFWTTTSPTTPTAAPRARDEDADGCACGGRPSALSRGKRRRPCACGEAVGALAGEAPTAAHTHDEDDDGRVRGGQPPRGTTVGALAGKVPTAARVRDDHRRSHGRRRRPHGLATRTPTAACVGDDRQRSHGGGADGCVRGGRP